MSKIKTKWMITTGASALGIRFTEAERLAGRLLRAPDHDAGTGGASDGGSSDGATGGDAGPAAGEGAGASDGQGDSGGGAAGDAGQAAADGDGKSGVDAPGGEDKTILGDLDSDGSAKDGQDGKAGDADGSGDGQQEGAARVTFGEGDDAKPILGAPEAYSVELPAALAEAGVTFDKEAFEAVEPILRDLNLSNEAASALTSAYAEKILPLLTKRAGEANDALGADMRRNWSTQAEKEFDGREGRASLPEVKALCKQAFIRAGVKGDSPFLTLMEESGLGSHPDMIRTMAYFGRAMGEAGVESAGGGEPPMRTADKIYGKPVPRE